ncbi:MAG: hypothetical protein Q8T08_22805 [Ignavibacteria bacterium]|nr:hypothetical protein [Ignavibacteria bacterium]
MFSVKSSFFPLQSFKNNTENIAVIVGKSHFDGQLHSGIVFKYKEEVKVIHLAFHKRLYLENESDFVSHNDGYHWVKTVDIPLPRQIAIAAFCRRIYNLSNIRPIAYGFNYENSRFTNEGYFILGKNEIGLTCASFVLAVFHESKVPLIDISQWVSREDDATYREMVLAFIKTKADESNNEDLKKHYQKMSQEKVIFRYRPEEVAVSSSYSIRPQPFDVISTDALILKQHLLQ